MEFHALPPVLRSEVAFSRSPGGKLNGADPNGSSATWVGWGETVAVIGAGGGAGAAATATGIVVMATVLAFCSVGVSVEVVEADLAVMPAEIK